MELVFVDLFEGISDPFSDRLLHAQLSRPLACFFIALRLLLTNGLALFDSVAALGVVTGLIS